MFKIVAILAICWLSVSQAFDCELPCPEHSKCVAQDKCECEYGYKNAFGDLDGLPYCQWQGTTTTKRTSSDNEGFHEDYSHEEDHKQDIESNSTSKVNGIRKPPVIMEESQIIIEGNRNENFKEITTEIVPETSTEMWNIETSTVMATIESDTETNTETTSEAITEIPTSSEIPDLTATTQETNDVVLHNVDENEHHHHNDAGDDFQKFQLNKISQKENSSSEVQNSLDTTTEDVEVTTVRGAIKVVKITKHVEQIIYKNTANQTFYTFLGILCPSLAFIFAMAVLFDCVKL